MTDATYRVAVSSKSLASKIPPGSPAWRDFNASFVNRELTPFDFAQSIWDGHPFTTWHKDGWRTTANYLCGQHLGLDFDNSDATSTLPALMANPFIHRHAAILYTTPSHTPEAPRARVVFLLDTPIMQATNYALAAQALLWLFGTADRQCKDPARFFYGSLRCEMEMFDNVLPLATVKHVIGQYQATGRRELARHARSAPTVTSDRYTTAALRNEVLAVKTAPQGERNNTLNRACWNLARFIATGELSQIDIEDALTEAALVAGLEQAEITATLRSAFRAAGKPK